MHFPENTNDEKRTKKKRSEIWAKKKKNMSLSDEARVGVEDNKYV